MNPPPNPSTSTQTHLTHLRHALTLARNSPPLPTNFRVGAVLVSSRTNTVLSTGYTLELPGNTHAEQCCLAKLAAARDVPVERVGCVLPPAEETVLYTTVEPCAVRLSGNESCVMRILGTRGEGGRGIGRVVCGVREPDTFVGRNVGRGMLEEKGVEVVFVEGMEEEILEVAMAGHGKTAKE
jgi:pyrimidine deaminase RibD-like protein